MSIRKKDIKSFERNVMQLTAYYYDFEMIQSNRFHQIIGLQLLSLLAQNRIAEFHMLVERIGVEHLENEFVQHVLEIERALIEGRYNKVLYD